MSSVNIVNALAIIPLIIGVINLWMVGAWYGILATLFISTVFAITGLVFAFRAKLALAYKLLFWFIIGQNISAIIGIIVMVNHGAWNIALWLLIISIIFSLGVVIAGFLVPMDGNGKKIAKTALFISYAFVPLTYIAMVAIRTRESIFAFALIATIGVALSFIAYLYFASTADDVKMDNANEMAVKVVV